MFERTCKGCGDWSLCFDGYCGDCAPASSVDAYVAWQSSGPGIVDRQIMAEQLLSVLALDQADQGDESDQVWGVEEDA